MCYCDSGLAADVCCNPLLLGSRIAQSPLELMRSRYSAFVTRNPQYLEKTAKLDALAQWNKTKGSQWQAFTRLEIIACSEINTKQKRGFVEFKAYYINDNISSYIHERSQFQKIGQCWYYIKGRIKNNPV